ncbi:sensor histidine kinase [Gordonia aichiensis]|uniref:sensor histidine kinase n=1 Tax=Gordonia aichiensis TaxID=36820 RepID=UPI003265B277
MVADTAAPTPGLRTDTRLDGASGLTLLRLASVFVTTGYAAYFLVALPAIIESATVMAPWWSVSAPLAVFLPGFGLGILGARARTARRIRTLALCAVVGYALTLSTWWFAWSGEEVKTTTGIWFSMFFGVAALGSTLAFRARYAFVTLGVFATGCTAINHAIRPRELGDAFIPGTAWAIGFSLVFVAAGAMVAATAQVLDESREQEYAASARAAAVAARGRERARFDALTHDNVMATLLMASRYGPSAELAGHAQGAVRAIDHAQTGEPETTLDLPSAVAQICAAASTANPDVIAGTDVGPGAGAYPGQVIGTFTAATAEAVRNSTRHAGPGASIRVQIRAEARRLTVVIADDGVGFDPTAVPPTRFGIAISIRGRMHRLDGGECTIVSAPAAGTRIELRWVG